MNSMNPQSANSQNKQLLSGIKRKKKPTSQLLVPIQSSEPPPVPSTDIPLASGERVPPSAQPVDDDATIQLPPIERRTPPPFLAGQGSPVSSVALSRKTRPLFTENNRETIEQAETVQTPSVSLPSIAQKDQLEQVQTILMPQVSVVGVQSHPVTLPPVAPPPAPPLRITDHGGNFVVPVLREKAGPVISRKKALFLIAVLCVIVAQAIVSGPKQFLGKSGWASVLDPSRGTDNLLGNPPDGTPGAQTTVGPTMTPEQYIESIIGRMTLDQKLGQMLMVQFEGANYSTALAEMVTQYHIGAAFLLVTNGNITEDGERLKDLINDMQTNSDIPMTIAVDQEGGLVDRMQLLHGSSPSAEDIGLTGDPEQARSAGQQDAATLAEYGFTLNLAPVVDVNTLSSATMSAQYRTFSSDPAVVTEMAGAYLEGLQESGEVQGTLKHFPGIGGIYGDPHLARTDLNLTKEQLDQIDWAPYRALIQQGNVRSIMVTHTYVNMIDPIMPASLSPQLMAILREEMGFQGVIMTDSLSMGGIGYYPSEAAVLAIIAGSDMIMGAGSPQEVGEMITTIKQAVAVGDITEERIDESLRRILMMKYTAGQLPIPQQ